MISAKARTSSGKVDHTGRARLCRRQTEGHGQRDDFLSVVTAAPETPGIPRPVWLTIAASVPTGLIWYGWYNSVEEELFQYEFETEGRVSGCGGYGTLFPLVFGVIIGGPLALVGFPGGDAILEAAGCGGRIIGGSTIPRARSPYTHGGLYSHRRSTSSRGRRSITLRGWKQERGMGLATRSREVLPLCLGSRGRRDRTKEEAAHCARFWAFPATATRRPPWFFCRRDCSAPPPFFERLFLHKSLCAAVPMLFFVRA